MKNNPVTENKWTGILSDFVIYLRLERALADNTRYAYLRDINGFLDFLKDTQIAAGDTMPGPRDITGIHIQDYLASGTGKGI
ncbi:MAG: site-specific integrase, partial [Bacteroidales bacterium]